MFPFLDLVEIRLKNTSNNSLKIGSRDIGPGEEKDVPSFNLNRRILEFAESIGIEYVCLVVNGVPCELVPRKEDCPCPEPEVAEPEPVVEVEEEPEPAEEELSSYLDELMSFKKGELVELAESLGLDPSGNKPDIAQRIADHEGSN